MAEALFYHLTESRLEDALPALLEKSLERGWRVSVHVASTERRDALDSHLWTFRDEAFLPHGTDGGPEAARQPVLLTTEARPANDATVRFVADGAELPLREACDRLVLMFDGHDDQQVATARAQWKALKEEGLTLTYWQQTPERRWERKA